MIDNLNKTLDVGIKMATPLGVAVMLFMQSQFVTRSEFASSSDRVDARLSKIETVLIRMEAGAESDKRHDALLADHETRLRNIEKGAPK
jgi:hypothetical protein